MCMTSAHGTTNGSAYAIWWAMLCGTSTQTDRGCTRGPIFMRSLRAQPLSSALRLKNNSREQHECTNLMHSDLGERRADARMSSIRDADVAIVLGGGTGTGLAATLAEHQNVPIVPVPAFGSMAALVYQRLQNQFTA